MSPDFAPLLEYLDTRFGAVESRLTELGERFSDLQGSVDGYAKRADAYFQEMVMLAHKLDRHERCLPQLAERVGVKLEY